jgi:hypothetical protein
MKGTWFGIMTNPKTSINPLDERCRSESTMMSLKEDADKRQFQLRIVAVQKYILPISVNDFLGF